MRKPITLFITKLLTKNKSKKQQQITLNDRLFIRVGNIKNGEWGWVKSAQPCPNQR